jgi:hypothetical protein
MLSVSSLSDKGFSLFAAFRALPKADGYDFLGPVHWSYGVYRYDKETLRARAVLLGFIRRFL